MNTRTILREKSLQGTSLLFFSIRGFTRGFNEVIGYALPPNGAENRGVDRKLGCDTVTSMRENFPILYREK